MRKPTYHILLCNSFRATGAPQGVCNKKGAITLLQYLQEGLSDRGMNDVAVSLTNCLNVCDRGPAMVIYPNNFWYGSVTEEVIDAALDALATNEAAPQFLIA